METNAYDMNDQDKEPSEQCEYLHLLGMLDFKEFLLVVDYLCQTKEKG
jgi:hypothetical protein